MKNTPTRRLNKVEFFEVQYEVLSVIREFAWLEPTRAYRNKESFGDLDILYTMNSAPMRDIIKNFFNPAEMVVNGDVISFDYKGFQVDMIKVTKEGFQYASNYFAWNDLGNFVGKIAHKFGLSHGHAGLWMPVFDEDGNKFDRILLTQDYDNALGFLGFDVARYKEGFDDLEDVFQFVVDSKYFDSRFFLLDELNHRDRIRDKKRASYNSFLAYIKDMPPKEVRLHRDELFLAIDDRFPGTFEKYQEIMGKYALHKHASKKFNGDYVRDLTGLTGPELGNFMRHLKQDHRFSAPFIVGAPQRLIQERIGAKFRQYINQGDQNA